MIIHIIRAIYLLVVLAFATSFSYQYQVYQQGPTYVTLYILVPAICAFALVLLDMFWRRKRLSVLSGLFFGLLAGLVIAYGLTKIVDLAGNIFVQTHYKVQAEGDANPPETPPTVTLITQTQPSDARTRIIKPILPPTLNDHVDVETPILDLIKVLVGSSAIFLCVSFIMQTKDDFRFVIPYVEFAKQTKGARPLLLDTSVIIDGRVADIAETRILESELIVPRFVLSELQTVADSDDRLKRNRGRRGLDVLNRLRNMDAIDIRILDSHIAEVDDAPGVDAKLVALAKHLDGRVVTNDYNLNKVAQLRGVDVININDLANALKPVVLPGEMMIVKIVKPGEEIGQGVGYLDDGTMVVAEQGREHIGKEIVITTTSVLQTSAGRMIFGKYDADKTISLRSRSKQPPDSRPVT